MTKREYEEIIAKNEQAKTKDMAHFCKVIWIIAGVLFALYFGGGYLLQYL